MRLTYYAHSSFLLEAADGTRVIIDPYRSGCFGGAFRYGAIDETADAVVASHEHDDHGAVDTIPGKPQVFVHPADVTVGGWHIMGIDAAHDAEGGRSRGRNTIMIFDDGDVRVVHLGDLGHELDAATVAAIGASRCPPGAGGRLLHHRPRPGRPGGGCTRSRVSCSHALQDGPGRLSHRGSGTLSGSQPSVERRTESSIEVDGDTLPKERVAIVLRPAR